MTPSTPSPSYLVLGATGGIGSSPCRRLATRGARLVLAARAGDRLERLGEELAAVACPVDATRFEDVEHCVDRALQAHGKVDGIANCVGSLLLGSAHNTTEEEWTATLATNLTSAFAVVRSGSKAMLKTGGSIVIVSSAAARLGLANHEAIAAATCAPLGIRVHCVAPGLVRTSLTSRLTANEVSLKASTALHALGRIGEPEDVAAAIDWPLDSEQGFVTGQLLGIDGGLASVRAR